MSNARKQGLGGLLNNNADEEEERVPEQSSPPPNPSAANPTPRAVRRRKPPRDKLTVSIPLIVKEALESLSYRDETYIQDEVEEALTRHLSRKGIKIPK